MASVTYFGQSSPEPWPDIKGLGSGSGRHLLLLRALFGADAALSSHGLCLSLSPSPPCLSSASFSFGANVAGGFQAFRGIGISGDVQLPMP